MHLFTNPSARVTRAVTCALALAATTTVLTVGSAAAARSSAAHAAASSCSSGAIDAWLDTNGNGAAGSISYKLEFTNLSSATCTLFGYPGVSAVDNSGHQLGRAASRNTTGSPRTVRLASGATATVILKLTDVYNDPITVCNRVMAAGFRVYAPNTTAAKFVPYPFTACANKGPAFLTVRAVS